MQQMPNAYMADPNAQIGQMSDMCRKYHLYLAQFEAQDGRIYEGIIDGVDDDHVNLLVPCGEDNDDDRQFPIGAVPYGGFPYGAPYGGVPYGGFPFGGLPYGFGYPRRFRRFRRQRFPLFGLRRFFFPPFY